jgi:hypothetical protein
MTKWYDSQKKPSSDFRKLLQKRIEKQSTPQTTNKERKAKAR